MENYRAYLQELIKRETGNSDVLKVEYRDFDTKMTKESFDSSLVIGNVNLFLGNFKTPSEANVEVANFINLPIP